MHEKVERNKALYEYHLKHPNTGCTKIGRVFHYKKDGKWQALSPSAVWRIIKLMEKRQEEEKCPSYALNQ